MRKILISPGNGAGWTTWNRDEVRPILLEYKPIIEFLEAGGDITSREGTDILLKLNEEVGDLCLLGASDLMVVEVEDDFMIKCYNGYESVEANDKTFY